MEWQVPCVVTRNTIFSLFLHKTYFSGLIKAINRGCSSFLLQPLVGSNLFNVVIPANQYCYRRSGLKYSRSIGRKIEMIFLYSAALR